MHFGGGRRTSNRLNPLGLVRAPILLLLATCGTEPSRETQTNEGPEEAAQPTLDALPGDGAQASIVHIEAWGVRTTDWAAGAQVFVKRGSGFVIDPKGLVVTASHLVGTASQIEVYFDVDEPPVEAEVLGVAECADLAVLDLAGDGFRHLEWYESKVEEGLEIFVADHPNGHPAFELHGGEVVAEWPFGAFRWASIDATLEHTAEVEHGASGGPLLTADGSVAGVALAHGPGEDPTFFAIPASVARPIVAELAQGRDVDAIGAALRASRLAPEGLGGIWVQGLTDDSPATRVGLQGGDVITRIADQSLVDDRTLESYCAALRDAEPGRPIEIEVLRTATGEMLEGALGGEPLMVVGRRNDLAPLDPVEAVVAADPAKRASEQDFVVFSDERGLLRVELPAPWIDIDVEPFADGDPPASG